MISHIYTLDINSVNNMITEMNRDLNKRVSQASTGEESRHLIANILIGSPSTEIVANDLDLSKSEIWGFTAHLRNSNNTPSYSLFFNNDKNVNNYHITTMSTTNGAAVQGAAATNSIFRTAVANGTNVITGTIVLVNETKEVYVQYSLYGLVAEYLQVGTIRYTLRPEHDNIFKIVISSSVENALTKDSHLRVYKVFHKD